MTPTPKKISKAGDGSQQRRRGNCSITEYYPATERLMSSNDHDSPEVATLPLVRDKRRGPGKGVWA